MTEPQAHLESMEPGAVLRTCPTCGQAQIVPNIPPRMYASCVRC